MLLYQPNSMLIFLPPPRLRPSYAWELLPAHLASPKNPHILPRTLCPGAGGGWMSPTQPPPFERHPHPAGDEGNATAKVAPSGLGQCHVVEPESARARPGSHDTHGQGLLERDQVWSVMRTVRVTLPLHYRYITVTSPLHHRYITVTQRLRYTHTWRSKGGA